MQSFRIFAFILIWRQVVKRAMRSFIVIVIHKPGNIFLTELYDLFASFKMIASFSVLLNDSRVALSVGVKGLEYECIIW